MFQDFALEHPDLDATGAVGRECRCGAVIDIGAQRMQRHAALTVPFDTRDFRTAQATRAVDADTLGAQPHGRLYGALHGAPEGDAALELLGNRFGDQCGIDLGLAHLDDIDRHLTAGHATHELAQLLDIRTFLADHHTRACRVNGYAALLCADAR